MSCSPNNFLHNSVQEPGYPCRNSREWLGCDVLQLSEGVFIDGHEHSDVVESRDEFLRTMTACGFLHPDTSSTEEAAKEDGEVYCVVS